ncbi:hypothetical protein SDC9_163912 [bioreactor metagenome]|uniref:Uncharacterized protein n=1 Tax=bioreactor metagenome TaxID=1076179 RepID=A0A645FQ62_9ZZZZ
MALKIGNRNVVQLLGGHTDFGRPGQQVERLLYNASCHIHLFDVGGGLDRDTAHFASTAQISASTMSISLSPFTVCSRPLFA